MEEELIKIIEQQRENITRGVDLIDTLLSSLDEEEEIYESLIDILDTLEGRDNE